MKSEPLSMYCECGRPASEFTQVDLTDDHQLMFRWWCDDCDKPVYSLKGLAECWRECPPRDETVPSEPLDHSSMVSEDLMFLGTMGIRHPCDEERD